MIRLEKRYIDAKAGLLNVLEDTQVVRERAVYADIKGDGSFVVFMSEAPSAGWWLLIPAARCRL